MIDSCKTCFGDHNKRGGETALGFGIVVAMLRLIPSEASLISSTSACMRPGSKVQTL